ncbi:ATP-binding protein [Herbiconiux sp. A18JL235]|uniref:histidine kinase n=1 Tax=Herbiconiux sp. A18JL235 TaxID=3152363 RepID=A0AB39BDS7_9MICO
MSVRLSVRVRILATLLAVAALGMVAAGATAYFVQRERVLSAVDERLVLLAGDVGTVAEEAVADGFDGGSGGGASGGGASGADAGGGVLDDVMTAIVQRVRPGANESSLGIVDGVAALNPGGSLDFRIDRDDALVARVVEETSGGEVVRGTFTAPDGQTLRYVAVPVRVAGDDRSGVFVSVVDLRAELRPLTDAFTTYAVIAAGALVVVAVVGWFVAGRLLAPIRRLTDAADRISASDLSERIPVVGNDDISQLTTTVNGMLDRLEEALTAQRQLLDDVGHELKTPITIVRGHLELVDEDDPADVTATRDLAVDELDRMNGLVDDIARLAAVGRSGAIVREAVDVGELTDRLLAKARGIGDATWVLAGRAGGVASLDVDRITQAVLQLAANAVTHGGSAGQPIELGSAWNDERDPVELRFWVHDHGPGVPVEAQSRIFERFQRVRGGGGRGASGSGLGLAIVAGIAAAHGGSIAVQSSPGNGARFILTVPVEEAVPVSTARGAGAVGVGSARVGDDDRAGASGAGAGGAAAAAAVADDEVVDDGSRRGTTAGAEGAGGASGLDGGGGASGVESAGGASEVEGGRARAREGGGG